MLAKQFGLLDGDLLSRVLNTIFCMLCGILSVLICYLLGDAVFEVQNQAPLGVKIMPLKVI